MKKHTLNICFVLVIILPIISPAQVEEWVARYNGPDNGYDDANAITLDNAGNIYVTGSSWGSGTYEDYATVKYNTSGVEQWVARYNGLGNYKDGARAIGLDGAGNIYVTGYSVGSGTDYDYATVKYDASGVEHWVARYNGPGNSYDRAYAIGLDGAGNIYVTGYSYGSGTYDDYATVKYDSSGVEQWVARYNGSYNRYDRAYAIGLDGAGNIYVTGYSYGSGTGEDYATVKYDASGVEQWVVRYNGPDNLDDGALAIGLDGAGNIYVTGYSYAWDTDEDYATVKYDASGVEQWVARYNGPGNYKDGAYAIGLDGAGNIYVTGYSNGSGTRRDYATVKYDASGVEQWVARYNGQGNDDDVAYAIGLDSTGNIYVTGNSDGSGTQIDYATVKYNASGVEQWVARYNGPGNSRDGAYAIGLDGAGNVYVTGGSYGSGTGSDYATIKYSPAGIEEQRVISVKNNYEGPTIFSGPLHLSNDKNYRVFDVTGRVVERDKMQPGIYFIEVDGEIARKVIKIR